MKQVYPSRFYLLSLPLCLVGLFLLAACKKEQPENPATSSNFDLGVAQILEPGNPLIAVYSDREGKEALSILGTKDSVFGSPLSFTHIVLTKESGGAMQANTFELYANGKPKSFTDADGLRLEFGNFTTESVEVTLFDKNGVKLAGPAVAKPDMAELEQVVNSYNVSSDCASIERPFFQWLEYSINVVGWVTSHWNYMLLL